MALGCDFEHRPRQSPMEWQPVVIQYLRHEKEERGVGHYDQRKCVWGEGRGVESGYAVGCVILAALDVSPAFLLL